MGLKQLFKSNRQSLLTIIYLFAAPFFFDTILISLVVSKQELFTQLTLAEWAVFYLITIPIMAFGFTHTTIIALFSGYFLSWKSVPFVLVSYLLASAIGYWAGLKLSKGEFANSIQNSPKALAITRELKKREFFIILLSRLSPILPFAVTNYLLAFVKAKFSNYLVAGGFGMLPRTLLFIWIGSQAQTIASAFLSPKGLTADKISTLILLIISVAGFYYFLSRALRNSSINK